MPKWSDVDMEPVAKSTAIWNSIHATEERKHYYALVAKDLAEMDAKLEKDAKPKKPKTN